MFLKSLSHIVGYCVSRSYEFNDRDRVVRNIEETPPRCSKNTSKGITGSPIIHN